MKGQRAFATVARLADDVLVFDLEQVRQRSPQQVFGLAAEQLGNRGGNIQDQAAAVGFPEPTLPGFLIIGENFLRAGLFAFGLLQATVFRQIDIALTVVGKAANRRADDQCQNTAQRRDFARDRRPHCDLTAQQTGQSRRLDDRGQQRHTDQHRHRLQPRHTAALRPMGNRPAVTEHRSADRHPDNRHPLLCTVRIMVKPPDRQRA